VEFVRIESTEKALGQYGLALKSLYSRDPYTINWLKSRHYEASLKARLKEAEYDLVHFDTISLAPYRKYINNIPAILDHHNIESHMLLRRAKNEGNILKKWYFKQEGLRLESVEKLYCPNFSLNITCSEIDAERLRTIASGCRVEEVPNPVDIDYFKPDVSVKQAKSLLFVGSLNWYPNIQAVRFIANELWPSIKRAVDGISIDIIGAGPPEEIVLLSKSDPDFRVHGFVDDITPFFNNAAIYICPITDGGGTKLKILDALAMQKAIIANPIACEGIRVKDGVDVVFAKSAEEYTSAIVDLLKHESRRLEIGINARSLAVREYSCGHVAEKLSALCISCVSESANHLT
jgi:glycosyltransferase involved in cell wall biosynthesis